MTIFDLGSLINFWQSLAFLTLIFSYSVLFDISIRLFHMIVVQMVSAGIFSG